MRLLVLSNIFSLLLGGFLVYKFFPRTEIVHRDVEVVREIEVRDVVTKIVKVYPDGTKEETTIVDKTKKEVDKSTEVIITNREKDWSLSLMYSPLNISGDNTNEYTVSIERRVLGPWRVGAFGSSTGAIGVSVGVSW